MFRAGGPALLWVRELATRRRVRQEDDVQVHEDDVEPAWDEYEQDAEPLEGGRVWKVEVEPGQERPLKASWSIRVPSQHELVGGNRRDV
jgi:hypothetical protein